MVLAPAGARLLRMEAVGKRFGGVEMANGDDESAVSGLGATGSAMAGASSLEISTAATRQAGITRQPPSKAAVAFLSVGV